MIIKSIGCKTKRFRQLLAYINKSTKEKSYPRPILHNLKTRTHNLSRIEAEFLQNAQHIQKRKGAVIFFHEIISIHPQDYKKASPQMLENLVYKYLDLRAKNALSYGKIELGENGAWHCHLMIAGNVTGSSKKLTLNKFEFDRIKRNIEQTQKSLYPELTHSVIYDQAKKERTTIRKTNAEEERETRYLQKGRTPPPTRKEEIRIIIQKILTYTSSKQDLINRLQQAGFEFYIRGQVVGVKDRKDQKKYRFSTLGLLPALTVARQQWQRLPEALNHFEQLGRDKVKNQVKQLGFRTDIQQILSSREQTNLPVDVQESLKRIKEHQRSQRAKMREQTRNLDQDLGGEQGLGY